MQVTIPFQMTATDVTDLRLAASSGVLVWHVRASRAGVPAWATKRATVDFYIAQSDDLLIRLSLSAAPTLGGHETREKVTDTFSRYGKPITVTKPQQCR